MASKRYRKTTPEERERWRENQRRLEELIERRLERDGLTREEIRRRLGLPSPR
jgi:hypothetical protein